MKFASILCIIALPALAACSSPKGLVFADREWHVTSEGLIADNAGDYRMTFGDVLIPDPLTVISSADSAARYPGMNRFIADILHTARLDSAKILFYAPHMHTMFVIPKTEEAGVRPSSITSDMNDERPYTMWLYDDDVEDWKRRPGEMYTYTYFNKRKKQILVVDFYNYGDTPMAQIFVFQSYTRAMEKMRLNQAFNFAFFKHDASKYERDMDAWASWISGCRKLVFANYRLGKGARKHSHPAAP